MSANQVRLMHLAVALIAGLTTHPYAKTPADSVAMGYALRQQLDNHYRGIMHSLNSGAAALKRAASKRANLRARSSKRA